MEQENIRRRKPPEKDTVSSSSHEDSIVAAKEQRRVQTASTEYRERKSYLYGAYTGSYWLTRILFIRCLGAIYCKFDMYSELPL